MTDDPCPDAVAPDLDHIHRLAVLARDRLPPPFDDIARGVALRVEDFASDQQTEALDIDDAFALSGLYEGVPLSEKSVMDQPHAPDMIWLFRRPLLDEWAARGNVGLAELVAHVFVHELAHHLGWSDADIAAIDRWWE